MVFEENDDHALSKVETNRFSYLLYNNLQYFAGKS